MHALNPQLIEEGQYWEIFEALVLFLFKKPFAALVVFLRSHDVSHDCYDVNFLLYHELLLTESTYSLFPFTVHTQDSELKVTTFTFLAIGY